MPRRSAADSAPWALPLLQKRRARDRGTARLLGARNRRDSSVVSMFFFHLFDLFYLHFKAFLDPFDPFLMPWRLFTWMAKPLRLWPLWLLKVINSTGCGCRAKAAAAAKPLCPCCPAWVCGSTSVLGTAVGALGADGLSSPRSKRSRPPPLPQKSHAHRPFRLELEGNSLNTARIWMDFACFSLRKLFRKHLRRVTWALL